MMKYRTNTLTEQASQLYDIADSLGNREKAIVFWAAILGELKADYEDDEAE